MAHARPPGAPPGNRYASTPRIGLPPESQHVCDLFTRMNEQLIEKRKNIRTVEDIFALFTDEIKFVRITLRALSNLPINQRARVNDLTLIQETLLDDFFRCAQWEAKYTRDRKYWLKAITYQEKYLEPRPDFKILKLKFKGNFIRFTLSEKVSEFEFRVRQSIALFHQIIETHCSLTAPPEAEDSPQADDNQHLTPYDSFIHEPKKSFDTVKVRFQIDLSTAPYPFDNYSPIFSHNPDVPYLPDRYPTNFYYTPTTRIPSRDYIIDPGCDLKANCLRYVKLFTEFAVRKGNLNEHPFAKTLPYVPVHYNEVDPEHPLNSIDCLVD